MIYKGISLEIPESKASFSHSHAMDMIRKKSGDQNVEWLDKLGELPWGQLKQTYPERFEDAGKIFSLASMDYQVCNGGIAQYFDNRYHEERDPFSEHDVFRYDFSVQQEFFKECVEFAQKVFPQRADENSALDVAFKAFSKLSYEENAQVTELIECDEDEYIFDDELGEEVENPDWFEPYEDTTYEDVIHDGEGFDDIFYAANDYLEELLELQAQLCCKILALDVQKHMDAQPDLLATLKEILPDSAFRKPALSEQIQTANVKSSSTHDTNTPSLAAEAHAH